MDYIAAMLPNDPHINVTAHLGTAQRTHRLGQPALPEPLSGRVTRRPHVGVRRGPVQQMDIPAVQLPRPPGGSFCELLQCRIQPRLLWSLPERPRFAQPQAFAGLKEPAVPGLQLPDAGARRQEGGVPGPLVRRLQRRECVRGEAGDVQRLRSEPPSS